MFVLSSGHNYIGLSHNKTTTTVVSIKNALTFDKKKKAENFKENLKATLKKFNWEVVEIEDDKEDVPDELLCDDEDVNVDEDDDIEDDDEDCSDIDRDLYIETNLERTNFDIAEFFKNTITTMSQLKSYASNMRFLEREYNKKIKDTRHYKRDKRTKLNAIQLQRLAQFEQQLERERYECKSNRKIAQIFMNDYSRIANINYIEVVKSVKESEYKPEILTYEMLDEIVGKKRC